MRMFKRKFTKLFIMLGVIFLSLFTTSCSENNVNSNQDPQDRSSIDDQNGTYRLIRFDKQPNPIGDWELYEKTISIVKDTEQLNEIFTSYIGEEMTSYFSNEILSENIVLFIMRYEDSRYDIGYFDFYVEETDLHLSEKLLSPSAAEVLTFYMDFVIIPKTDSLSDLITDEPSTNYNWIIHDEWK